jgi:hypothetical protein
VWEIEAVRVELADLIVNDLEAVFNSVSQSMPITLTRQRTFELSVGRRVSRSALSWPAVTTSPYGGILSKYFGHIVEVDGEKAIVITNQLCGEYERAFAVYEKHLVQYRLLSEFIAWFNDGQLSGAMRSEELGDVCYLGNVEHFFQHRAHSERRRLVEAHLDGINLKRLPSVLALSVIKRADEQQVPTSMVRVDLQGIGYSVVWRVVWHNGRWKLELPYMD